MKTMTTKPTNPDRTIKGNAIIWRKLNSGDLVEHTTKSGVKSLWRVLEVTKDEIMYGPMKGSQMMYVEIVTPFARKTVNRNTVVKIDEVAE